MASQLSQSDLDLGLLYPDKKQIRDVSVKIACDVIDYNYKMGTATTYPKPRDLEKFVREQLYNTSYTSYVPKTWQWPQEHREPRNQTNY